MYKVSVIIIVLNGMQMIWYVNITTGMWIKSKVQNILKLDFQNAEIFCLK